jgi:hypothetical protein
VEQGITTNAAHGLKTISLVKNKPYVNPARDLKPGRRLRIELRDIPLCDSADGVVRKGSYAYRGEEYLCPGGAIINGFAVPCWSLAHDVVLTRDQVREVAS